MEGPTPQTGDSSSANAFALTQLKHSASTMSAWLKFLGIVTIISGAISAISIVGILVAWLPIWMGVLLFQAGDRAQNASYSEDLTYLVKMMEKLKTYFIISGVVTIVALAFVVLAVFFMGSMFHELSTRFPDFMQTY